MDAFREAGCDFLLVSFSSDWLFTPQQSTDIVNALTALDKSVTYAEITTVAGHDAFLIDNDIDQYGPLVAAALGQPGPAVQSVSAAEQQLMRLIPADASVLDLGCGNGHLLAALQARGNQRLMGVEVAQANILSAAAAGLDVIDYDLNKGLPAFTDEQFDVVVLNATLQAVENVRMLIDEMLRVGKQVIVSFPNFAYKTLRNDFVKHGRIPKAPGAFSHDWYDTPNRRFPTIIDVKEFCRDLDVEIREAIYFDSENESVIAEDDDPNLNADIAIVVLGRK